MKGIHFQSRVIYIPVIHEIKSRTSPDDAARIILEHQGPERGAERQLPVAFARWMGNCAYSTSLALDNFSVKHIMPNLLTSEQHQQAFVALTMASAGLLHVGKFMHHFGAMASPENRLPDPIDSAKA